MSAWTEEEIAALRAVWSSGGIHAAREALPGRSERAIYSKAWELLGAVRYRAWTPAEEERLRGMWDAATTLPRLAQIFGRTELAVYHKAHDLRLGVGCPQGYEYFSQAARRTGCSREQLRRALRTYRDPEAMASEQTASLRRPLSLSPRARKRNLLVEPDTADAAVAKWCKDG